MTGMTVDIPLFDGLSLAIADRADAGGDYPTRRLQKGLLLLDGGHDLTEEGVGFGVPILKRGSQTIFAGAVRLSVPLRGPVVKVVATFEMDLVERLSRRGGGGLKSQTLYAAKNSLAALHRHAPPLRRPLTGVSNALRRVFGWVTTYEKTGAGAELTVTYTVDREQGLVGVVVDLLGTPEGVTEVVVMNELGARYFGRYEDSQGAALTGGAIGTWDEVTADRAAFVSVARRVAFSLKQVDGATLHRGTELIGSRVAWAGFGYSVKPARARLAYDLRIERRP